MDYRNGEPEKSHFRSERFYCADSEWYFSTREGDEMGPFSLRADAEAELTLFLRHTMESGMTSTQRTF